MDGGPNSPSHSVGGIQAGQGPYYHLLGSEETVSHPQRPGKPSLISAPGNEGPFLSWIQASSLFIYYLVSIIYNHQSSPTPNLLSIRHRF